MNALRDELEVMPLRARWAFVGAAALGMSGAFAGLVVGLVVYTPTAWFAMFELGVPSAVVGGMVGLLAAVLLSAGRRLSRPFS
jgi:hypothetical protein